MPVVTVTVVTTGTDTLTAVAHGLTTGDRFRLRNVGGALPAATPALAGATDYFAIRTGADTLKISDTNAHALAGTNIVDLTGTGSGTLTIEYGLPYCIPRIAANGTQVFPEDDNGAWNALVALYALLTGQVQAIWTSIVLAANLSITVSGTGQYKHGTRTLIVPVLGPGSGTSGPTASIAMDGSHTKVWVPFELPAGKRILTTRAIIRDSVTGPTKIQVGLWTADNTTFSGGGTSNGTNFGTQSAGSGSVQTITSTAINHTVVSGEQYAVALQFSTGTAASSVGFVEVDYDE